MSETNLSITPEAEVTLGDMRRRVYQIATEYGRSSDEHIKALESLLDNVLGVLRLGGRISRDGELSLFGSSFIAYGVIFHAKYINVTERDPLLGDWSTHSLWSTTALDAAGGAGSTGSPVSARNVRRRGLMASHCWLCGRPLPCAAGHPPTPDDIYDGLYDDQDGYDRNGVLGADGNVYSDADPGL